MEEFKGLTKTSSVVKISSCLEKIYQKIVEGCEKRTAEHNIKEIEFLKTQCKSDSVQLSLMSCQTMVRLAENGSLEVPNVLAMLIAMLPNSNSFQYTAITEGIVSLLLLSLKRKTATLKENDKFQCQFGIKTQQHPLITLIQKDAANMNDVANKIMGICNHHDQQIKEHSVEYLRPVFLYILCNPQALPDSKTIWTGLLSLSNTNDAAKKLMQEIICWTKISTPSTCLFTSILLIEAIEHYQNRTDHAHAMDLIVFQALVINNLMKFGIDPRPSLQCLLRILHSTKQQNRNLYNVLLVLFAETLHIVSPLYLPEVLRVIAFIVCQQNCGNQYILNMCLDGIIQWMSQTAFIPADGLALAHQIVRKILARGKTVPISTKDFASQARNFHPDIAIAFDIAKLVECFDESEFKDVFTFVDSLNVKTKLGFCRRINYFLRALFLSQEPSVDCWFKIYEIILDIVKGSEDIAYDFMMTYVFKLSGETNPELQVEMLRGLPQFAVSKDNIPMILSTIKSISDGPNATFCMDLYLKLWRVESRTYPFLVKLISQPCKDKDRWWEFQVVKSHIIKEICCDRPNQYGADLVSHLSDTLNTCVDENGDLATSIALDAIISLCDSNTVNIVSTWKALSGKFRHEKRPLALRSLVNFFAHVPLLQSPTAEYQELVDEVLDTLWLTISRSDDADLVTASIKALTHFEIGTLMTVRHIPPQYKQNIADLADHKGREVIDLHSEYVPGECWVQLLQKVKPESCAAVADLLSHLIREEINTFRSGVYRQPEGKPEPRKLQGLYTKSPLKATVNYLVNQSRLGDHIAEPIPVTNALRAISRKFSKPIPPLDWCFLHSFFHLSFEARKYCILIAKNQALHSGTAKRLLENFLAEFEPNCFEEDLLLLFTLLPEISNAVSLQILKGFVEKVALYCFKESQLNGFVEGCLFEKFLDSIRSVFTGNCEIPEVFDIFTLIVERYMDSMDLDSRLFERYTEVVASLHPSSIDGLTSPATWWETPIGKLKKATIIRCYLVLYNTKLANPLTWLNPIVDAFADKPSEHVFLFRHLAATLHAFNDDKNACAWVMDLFLQIQGLLAESSNKDKLNKVFFLLDIFVLAIDVLSGCAVLLGNLDVIATSRSERMQIFPESLQVLCDHVFWKDNESKIYEFLLHLYKNNAMTELYSGMFKDSIICSRNKPYFESKAVWMKFLEVWK